MYWLSLLPFSLFLVSVLSAPTYFDKSASAQKASCLGYRCVGLVEVTLAQIMGENWDLLFLCDALQTCSSEEKSCSDLEEWQIQVVDLTCDFILKRASTSTISPATSQQPSQQATLGTTSSPPNPVQTPTVGSILFSDIGESSSISEAEASTDSSTSTFEQFTAPMIGGPMDVEPSSPETPSSTEPDVSTSSTSAVPEVFTDLAIELPTSAPEASTESATSVHSTSEPVSTDSSTFEPSEGLPHTLPETPETSSPEPEPSTSAIEPTTLEPSTSESAALTDSSSSTFEPTATFTWPPSENPGNLSTEPEASTDTIEPSTLEPSATESFTLPTQTPDSSSTEPEVSTAPTVPTTFGPSTFEPENPATLETSSSEPGPSTHPTQPTFEPSATEPFTLLPQTPETLSTEPESSTSPTEPTTFEPSTSGPDVTFEPSTTEPFTWLPPWAIETSSTEPGSSTAPTELNTFEPSTSGPEFTTDFPTLETDATFLPTTTETEPPVTEPTFWTTPTTPPSTSTPLKVLTSVCQKRLLDSGSFAEDTITRAFEFLELNVDRQHQCLIINSGLYIQHAVDSVREVCGQSDAEFVSILWNFARHAYRCDKKTYKNSVGGPISEDCLYANVFTNEYCFEKKNCSVMIAIHGGDFVYESASAFNPEILINNFVGQNRNIVVVSLNYRLGAFGFRQLAGDVGGRNLGLFDILAGVKWVRREIRSFGGNKDRITLMGHSAGAELSALFSISPLSKGLIHQQIVMSDVGFEKLSKVQLKKAYSCLRSKPAEEILDAEMLVMRDTTYYFGPPNVDGEFIVDYPDNVFRDNSVFPINTMIGTTTAELRDNIYINEPKNANNQEELLKDVCEHIGFEIYKEPERFVDQCVRYYGNDTQAQYLSDDMEFYSRAISTANLPLSENTKVYLYSYAYSGAGRAFNKYLNVTSPHHSEDFIYVFGTHRGVFAPKDYIIEHMYTGMFANFINFGNPRLSEDQPWLQYTKEKREHFVINFDANFTIPGKREYYYTNAMNFWHNAGEKTFREHFSKSLDTFHIVNLNTPIVSHIDGISSDGDKKFEQTEILFKMLFLAFILFLSAPVVTIPNSCFAPEIRNEARNCVNTLGPMYDKLKAALAGSWKSPNISKDINDFCITSVNCYKSLQLCAGIDKNLISEIDGICDLYNFQSGKFKDCYQKMDSNNYDNCVYSFFMSPLYVDAPTNRQRCQSLKSNGKCVKKKTQDVCSKDYASDFDDHLDGQLKRFSC
ncbi:hypothetical protein L3Y34_009244 [Caenorhabditis briggsae]|uniref:Uncharacterized protein n=1 Tax=Caenorhabditis briggsae TaxID=6238 RepID=A0AAE9D1R4_CAEBR|nr:hypothetical protein L3Y34_009244 [Caenorhabditis briggsae]